MWKRKKALPEIKGKLSHIAFIMDGNGRWASRRGLPREAGHVAGAKSFRRLVEYCADRGLTAITFYAFSTENWKRPKPEVDAILKLLDTYMEDALANLAKHQVRIRFLGDKSVLTPALQEKMCHLEKISQANPLLLQIAFNYGGRAEIVHAVNCALKEDGQVRPITEADIEANLYTTGAPDPDLIVRTAGELRLSNFLMWQSAYSEFYFADCLWPDFSPKELEKAIDAYLTRHRRYGGL